MTSLTYRVAAIVCAACLSACATQDTPYRGDGIAESAPTGSNIKSREGYRRGGSSMTVRVISREQLRDPATNNSGQVPGRDSSSRQ